MTYVFYGTITPEIYGTWGPGEFSIMRLHNKSWGFECRRLGVLVEAAGSARSGV